MASTHVALVTAGGTANRRIASSLYGYCQTAASTVAKTVSLYTGNSTTTDGTWAAGNLFHGLTITVRFRYSNTAANPTLNVNSTGAKRIYKYGTTSPGNTASTSWQANSVISLTYDKLLDLSGCWVMNDHLDDTTGGSGSVEYTLSGSGDDDEYTITATPTVGTATSATIPAATTTDAGVMTADDKTKLTGIESGAEVNVQADWNESDSTSDAYIQNKPTIPTVADYVIETGTSNSWRYRKWNGGDYECWRTLTPTVKSGTSFSGLYYATYTVNANFPITFTAVPNVIASCRSGTMGFLGDITLTASKITSYDMYRAGGGNVGSALSVYVIGRWK